MRKRQIMTMLVPLLLAIGGAVWAASGQYGYPGFNTSLVGTGYNIDAQTLATPNIRSAIAVTDTLTTTNVLSLPEFKVLGRQTLIITGRFTNSAATAGVQVAYIYKSGDPTGSSTSTTTNTIKEFSSVYTLTATSSQAEGAYYPSNVLYLDSNGAVTVRILCETAPSAGTVTLVCGSE